MTTNTRAVITLILLGAAALSCGRSPAPPDGWKEKVNNRIIGRITIDPIDNCAFTEGRNVRCASEEATNCRAVVSYTDGGSAQQWGRSCEDAPLIVDDGQFTYFYGLGAPAD